MGLLEGRVAIVTGASKGIGRALSLRFAREGASVVCAARSADLVKETAGLVEKAGGKAIAVAGDASLEADVARMVTAGGREIRQDRHAGEQCGRRRSDQAGPGLSDGGLALPHQFLP